MNAFSLTEEGKHYWICSSCIGDHARQLKAERCCMNLTMPDLDMTVGRQPNKPITEKGLAYLAQPMPDSIYSK